MNTRQAQMDGPTLKPEQVVEAFGRHFPKTRMSQAWIGFAVDLWELGVKAQRSAQEAKGGWRYEYFNNLQSGVLTAPGGVEYELRSGDLHSVRAISAFNAMLSALTSSPPIRTASSFSGFVQTVGSEPARLDWSDATQAAQCASDLKSEVIGCFDAALAEGLQEALAETPDERLKDLVERRLMHALYAAQAVPVEQPTPGDARAEFERLNTDSHGFRRSHRGTYVNPPIARDWKWFQAGMAYTANGGQA